MKTKLTAGATLDFLTADEMKDVLRNWSAELMRGAKFRRRAILGTVSGAGDLLIPGPSEDTFGPAEGFVWAVTRITVGGLDTAEVVTIYVNDVSPSQIIGVNVGLGTQIPTTDRGIILQPGDSLIVSGTGLTAGAQIAINAQIKEVPQVMAWAL